ncbi:fatty acid desaturase [Leptolyngbya sp. NIES-2104]|uniref:fatty acid desaturase n=1 Tax=Leptolyngbya sp. NIES-2104 TaxID=1552121 RepID=UPI0006EC7E0D|nr:fatty acid desaturase [Leptolyngbya sp. NIES-2104]GAP98085.1 phosphatidylcholine desaturase [Leptolyngbya sp. NIES-2104]
MTASLTPDSVTLTSSENLRLKDIIKTLPRECFQKDMKKAWTSVIVNVAMVGLGYWSIQAAPWFLLPFAWIFTGTALTGFFVIAHDCGHRSFAQRKWVNDLIGHIFMAPLIYPFHCWRILHNQHHNHTNKMDVDNAWQPWRTEVYDQLDPITKIAYETTRGRFWWLASVLHWAIVHFNLSNYNKRDHGKVKLSIAVVVGFAAIVFPTLFLTVGVWGFVKFWLLPWLVYHFWMSTFTLVHHTLPDIQFKEPEEWDAAQAQLFGTVHCDYPRWIEFLCHDINVHIPHHLSTAIPSYNLRLAHQSLVQNWGTKLRQHQFSWGLMKEITDRCHLYHPDYAYQSFRSYNDK